MDYSYISEQKLFVFKPLCIAAEQILSIKLNTQIQIKRLERITEAGRRNLLLRCWIDPADNLPNSFILKKVEGNYDPESNLADTRRLFNDWVGTQFLNSVSSESIHSPRFYGGDRRLGLIVIEDVPHQHSLVEPLLGSDRSLAETTLLQYAACLGKLHCDTIGKLEEFERLYQIAPRIKLTRASLDVRQLQSKFDSLAIEFDSDCLQDIETINTMLLHPEFLAYVHSDACPDNVLGTKDKLRLIDFETGSFNHAFIDAACIRMMFPSCWCSKALPLNLVRRMENAYRTILVEQCPQLENNLVFKTALVNACGFWLMYTMLRHLEFAIAEDRDFGISTLRQRILTRLQVFIDLSIETKQLLGLRSVANRLLYLLIERWSDVPNLPLYPAFC